MTERKRKRTIVSLSSSSSSEEEEEEVEDDDDDDDDYDDEEISEDEHEEESESDNVDEESEDDEDDGGMEEESLCNGVIRLLKEKKNLEVLSLKECKAYLRKHGLRRAGTKAVCVQRIKEHWRIKDGRGESLYPRSSFVINCTGDVCKGDVVLFTQKVYEKFDKVRRQGNLLGKRTVAGRVVKESYGSAKQQHTFTVEVLWSKGIKKLPPLFPLLVKGRNLYRLKTFRQRWNNEVERQIVLDEKHKRGRAARLVRAMKKSKKKLSANGRLNEGVKCKKCSHHIGSFQTRQQAEPSKRKHAYGHKRDTFQKRAKYNNHHQEVPPSRQRNSKRNISSVVGSKTTRRNWKHEHLNVDFDPALHPHTYIGEAPCPSKKEYHHGSLQFQFSGHDMGSISTMTKLPPLRPCTDPHVMTTFQHQGSNHTNGIYHVHSNPCYNLGRRNLNHYLS